MVQIKAQWSSPGKGVVPSPTPQCSSYQKVSLWVALDNIWPTYFTTAFFFLDIPFYSLTIHNNVETSTMNLNKYEKGIKILAVRDLENYSNKTRFYPHFTKKKKKLLFKAVLTYLNF